MNNNDKFTKRLENQYFSVIISSIVAIPIFIMILFSSFGLVLLNENSKGLLLSVLSMSYSMFLVTLALSLFPLLGMSNSESFGKKKEIKFIIVFGFIFFFIKYALLPLLEHKDFEKLNSFHYSIFLLGSYLVSYSLTIGIRKIADKLSQMNKEDKKEKISDIRSIFVGILALISSFLGSLYVLLQIVKEFG